MSGLFLSTKVDHEHSSRLATMPSLLRHSAGDRAVAGAILGRCRAAAHPPVRPAPGTQLSSHRRPRPPCDPDCTKHRFLEMVRARVQDRKGVEARLKSYSQDPSRPHGAYREFAIRYTAPVRLFPALAHPHPG